MDITRVFCFCPSKVDVNTQICDLGLLEMKLMFQDLSGPSPLVKKIELATNYYKIAVNIIINSWKPNFLFIFLNRFRNRR